MDESGVALPSSIKDRTDDVFELHTCIRAIQAGKYFKGLLLENGPYFSVSIICLSLCPFTNKRLCK